MGAGGVLKKESRRRWTQFSSLASTLTLGFRSFGSSHPLPPSNLHSPNPGYRAPYRCLTSLASEMRGHRPHFLCENTGPEALGDYLARTAHRSLSWGLSQGLLTSRCTRSPLHHVASAPGAEEACWARPRATRRGTGSQGREGGSQAALVASFSSIT